MCVCVCLCLCNDLDFFVSWLLLFGSGRNKTTGFSMAFLWKLRSWPGSSARMAATLSEHVPFDNRTWQLFMGKSGKHDLEFWMNISIVMNCPLSGSIISIRRVRGSKWSPTKLIASMVLLLCWFQTVSEHSSTSININQFFPRDPKYRSVLLVSLA